MQRIIFFLSAILLAISARSQDFNYRVSTDSVAWRELSTQTILNTGTQNYSPIYKIAIGFSFSFLGQEFDSITIQSTGMVNFDSERNYSFWGLAGNSFYADSAGAVSVLGYQLTGDTGNRELTIQFKNVGAPTDPSSTLSYQLIIRENGSFAFLMGTISGSAETNSLFNGPVSIGLVNQNMDTNERALLLSGSPLAPSSVHINESNPNITSLSGLPPAGYRYTFTPSN